MIHDGVGFESDGQTTVPAAPATYEGESYYQALFASTSDALLVADGLGRYIDANPAASALLGYSRAEFLSMSVADVVLNDSEWAESEYAVMRGVGSWKGEIVLRHKDGSTLVVEAHANLLPLPDQQLYLSVLRDVTERRRLEEQLREEARFVETLHRISGAFLAELDLHKLLQAVTDAATDVIGAEFGAFFYNATSEQGDAYLLYTLSGAAHEAFSGFPMPRKTRIFGPTFDGMGPVRLDDVTKSSLYGKNPPFNGMPEGHLPVRSYLAVSVIARSDEALGGLFFGHGDVGVFTEREERIVMAIAGQAAIAIDNARLFRAAQDAVRLRDMFLALASHELRTPLTTLRGYTELLQRRAAREGRADERDQRITRLLHQQSIRLGKLIDMLLDVSRIELGQLSLERVPVDLCQMVRQRVSELRETVERHTLHLECEEKDMIVEGDVLRLESVIQNLLDNAVKYSPEGGTIHVKLTTNQDKAILSISDEGIGIPAEAVPLLFKRFYRALNATDEHYGGLGLGLFIVKETLALHGGTVSVTSEEGKGSTFVISLPLFVPTSNPTPGGSPA